MLTCGQAAYFHTYVYMDMPTCRSIPYVYMIRLSFTKLMLYGPERSDGLGQREDCGGYGDCQPRRLSMSAPHAPKSLGISCQVSQGEALARDELLLNKCQVSGSASSNGGLLENPAQQLSSVLLGRLRNLGRDFRLLLRVLAKVSMPRFGGVATLSLNNESFPAPSLGFDNGLKT